MSSFPQILLYKGLAAAAVALLSVLGVQALVRSTTPPPISPWAKSAAGITAGPPPDPQVFLRTWCWDCHADGASKGNFAMDGPKPLTESEWDNIRRHVALHTMPPEGKPAPAHLERDRFEQDLLVWQAAQPRLPPPPALRRLTRREFSNALHDLLGVQIDPSALPQEESAHGFDNNVDLQPLPSTVLERYTSVIRQSVSAALLPPPVPAILRRYMPQELTGNDPSLAVRSLFLETESGQPVYLPESPSTAGNYRLSVTAYAHQSGDQPVQIQLMDHGPQPVRGRIPSAVQTFSATFSHTRGARPPSFRLANPFRDPTHPDPHLRVRRLLVQEVTLEGPLDGDSTPSASFSSIMGTPPPHGASWSQRLDPARDALDRFALHAWRRPPSEAESDRLTNLAAHAMANGFRYDKAMATAAEAILTSPRFLFLQDPSNSHPDGHSYAVAARLSHFLWSRPPDEKLLTEAARPWTPDRLRSTALRMLRDPRASAFAQDFAGQWLQFRNVTLAQPDPSLFPSLTPELQTSLRQSAELFFLHLVRENEPVLHLVNSRIAFTGHRLASWFEVRPPPAGTGFHQVTLTNPHRFGLLGHPALLMATSYPNRTSPVLRGKYILETLLGLQPPPAPPNVPTLEVSSQHSNAALTVRQALEKHRADPSCASCHRAIDPLGFPLEGFDAIGRPLHPSPDLSTETFTGHPVHNPLELRKWLTTVQGSRIVHHTAERLLTYALGRGLSPAEKLQAHQWTVSPHPTGVRFRDLIISVIQSPLFQGTQP